VRDPRRAGSSLCCRTIKRGPLEAVMHDLPNKIAGEPAAPRASAIYTTVNLAGLAAISLPAGRSPEGYPLGIQLVGAVGSEELLLDVAQAFESIHPWATLAPHRGRHAPRSAPENGYSLACLAKPVRRVLSTEPLPGRRTRTSRACLAHGPDGPAGHARLAVC
jgi:hypothetical protein